MQAVAQTGWALEFATEELKGDREIVMRAVSQEGLALKYATEELKCDREIVTLAVLQDSKCRKGVVPIRG